MGAPKTIGEHPDLVADPARTIEDTRIPVTNAADLLIDPVEQARRRRRAALMAAEGMWMHRTDVPKDGVQAQEQLRAEWR